MTRKSRLITSSSIIGFIVIIAIIIGTLLQTQSPKRAIQLTLVKLSPVKIANIPIKATATGNLIANQQTNISPKVGGYITAIDFKEGDHVKKDAVLIKLDNTKQLENLASARAAAAQSYTSYQRYLTLSKSPGVSDIPLNQLDSYRATSDKDYATYKTAQTEFNDMTLTAPFSGYLGAKTISIGDYVSPGQKLVSLVDTQHLKVQYSLPSSFTPQLQRGQAVTVKASFLPGKVFHAKVTYISPNVNTDSQTVEVHALLDNNRQALKPGQYVNVSQYLGTKKHAILVPEGAIFATINGYHVYTVTKNHNKVISIPVKLGVRTGNYVQITQGLSPTSLIITTGQQQVKAGQPVKVITPSQPAQ